MSCAKPMQVNIVDGQTISITRTSSCEYYRINIVDFDKKWRIVYSIIWRRYFLDKLVIPMNSTCATRELHLLSACPLVRKGEIDLWLSKVISNKLKCMSNIFSIETIDSQFLIISPLNRIHNVSLFQNWLARHVIKSIF